MFCHDRCYNFISLIVAGVTLVVTQISDLEGNLKAFDNSTSRLERLSAQVLSRLRHHLGQLFFHMFSTEELPKL